MENKDIKTEADIYKRICDIMSQAIDQIQVLDKEVRLVFIAEGAIHSTMYNSSHCTALDIIGCLRVAEIKIEELIKERFAYNKRIQTLLDTADVQIAETSKSKLGDMN